MDNDFEESDCEEMPDLNLTASAFQPYMFEPTKGTEGEKSASGSEENSDSDDDLEILHGSDVNEFDEDEETEHVSHWCKCNHCTTMSTKRESKCCKDTHIVDDKILEAEIECITLHEGFQANCLNQYVLETSYYEYVQENGPLEEDQLIHKVYRYIAYRRFVQWIYHWLGKRNRKVLPSCVIKTIRDQFPSQQYCGFKYPNKKNN